MTHIALDPPAAATPRPVPAVLSDSHNPEAELAFRFITETNRHVFLTGRAGTGKTTFLHRICQKCAKQLAVVAPTGVAAINAKGVTIHSLFQLPFGTLTPDRLASEMSKRRLSKDKQRLLRGLDLLIIDEVSMVRADVLDAVDYVLRRYRDRSQPFGGVQLLLIGDLHQLPPVVKDDEARLMAQYYATSYFFSSKALHQAGAVRIELKRIYRQTNAEFVQLLNQVRANNMSQEVLASLNSRFDADLARNGLQAATSDGTITLTSHRHSAREINANRLDKLAGEVHTFEATIKGKFSEHAFPAPKLLSLKVGAQVMFVKNDPERAYFNGKIGTVIAIDDSEVSVRCDGDQEAIKTGRVDWDNTKYHLNEATKEVSSETEGTFSQIPLRLAWAITIHKSQGLTFDKVIIDAKAAFAHGQVYVALSRCRTFEGIRLLSRIDSRAVRTDAKVNDYSTKQQQHEPTEEALVEAKQEYHRDLVREAFTFTSLQQALNIMLRHYLENESAFAVSASTKLEQLVTVAERELFGHAKTFVHLLPNIQAEQDFTQDLIPVSERTVKAAAYFYRGIQEHILDQLKALSFASDNQAARKQILAYLQDVLKLCRVARAQLAICAKPFSSEAFVRARVKADLAEEATPQFTASAKTNDLAVSKNTPLYRALLDWRNAQALANDLPATSSVTSIKVLLAISNTLPRTMSELRKIKGVGRITAQNYGDQMLNLVEQYCKGQAIPAAAKPQRNSKLSTLDATFALYQQKLSVEDIAKQRSLVTSTIEDHLTKLVGAGKLPISDFLSEEQLAELHESLRKAELTDAGKPKLSSVVADFNGKYDYYQVRMASHTLPSAE